ncbi:MAG: N-formylglutamate amidohydrolase [Caulobacterales bacterium]
MRQEDGDFRGASTSLLSAIDTFPVSVDNIGGSSTLLLLGDHAGAAIPTALKDLGLSDADRSRHIALDIGVAELGAELSKRLDAAFISQRYSRLVIDCNRPPTSETSIAQQSDGTSVPGNINLGREAARARLTEIFQPYHARIAAELDARAERRQPTILFALHSFTPVLDGASRPWRYGVLHRNDSAFSRKMLAALRMLSGDVGDNQPYTMDDRDFTIPFHADARGLDYLELEVRQDLIGDESGRCAVAAELADALTRALQS